jgi:hypothetical protein
MELHMPTRVKHNGGTPHRRGHVNRGHDDEDREARRQRLHADDDEGQAEQRGAGAGQEDAQAAYLQLYRGGVTHQPPVDPSARREREEPAQRDPVPAEKAIEGKVSAGDPIERIIELETEFTKVEADNRLECAELYTAMLAKPGMTARRLGNQVTKSHVHVLRMAKCWELHLAGDNRPFNEIYNSDEARGKKAVEGAEKPKKIMPTSAMIGQAKSLMERLVERDDLPEEWQEIVQLFAKLS